MLRMIHFGTQLGLPVKEKAVTEEDCVAKTVKMAALDVVVVVRFHFMMSSCNGRFISRLFRVRSDSFVFYEVFYFFVGE